MPDLDPGRRGKLWILPAIVALLVLVIFVGYNAAYLKQDAQRDQPGNSEAARPGAPR